MRVHLLAGGGTAGHVNPLLAVADTISAEYPQDRVLVLGTREGLESRLVPLRGYELLFIDKVPFPRRPNGAALAFPKRFWRARAQTLSYIREHRVDIVTGFGGYASAPAYSAAKRAGVGLVLHEANARPGLANIWGARMADAAGVAFAGTKLRGAEVVGMPLRQEIVHLDRQARRTEAAEFFGLDPNRQVLLVFGGSLGAQRLNEAIAGSWRDILSAGWQILHVTGDRSGWAGPDDQNYRVFKYLDRMDLAYALADAVMARSGAATVSEITALAIPAFYVPYAVGNGEQRLNAASAVAAGAAKIISDSDLTAELVQNVLVPRLQDAQALASMAAAAQTIGNRLGSENVVALIDRVVPPR